MRTHVILWLGVVAVIGMLADGAPGGPKPIVEVKATLRGEVLADGLVKAGDEVREADPLVYVKTQTGRGVAARATVDGRVTEVLVQSGALIRELGAVVARIDPK